MPHEEEGPQTRGCLTLLCMQKEIRELKEGMREVAISYDENTVHIFDSVVEILIGAREPRKQEFS